MSILLGALVFFSTFAIYDAIRKVNNNILDQTEEIRNLQEDLKHINKN
ncbi:hypothetical protein [Solibacillus cecembensis]